LKPVKQRNIPERTNLALPSRRFTVDWRARIFWSAGAQLPPFRRPTTYQHFASVHHANTAAVKGRITIAVANRAKIRFNAKGSLEARAAQVLAQGGVRTALRLFQFPTEEDVCKSDLYFSASLVLDSR
jgi:hypothetical protein